MKLYVTWGEKPHVITWNNGRVGIKGPYAQTLSMHMNLLAQEGGTVFVGMMPVRPSFKDELGFMGLVGEAVTRVDGVEDGPLVPWDEDIGGDSKVHAR